MAFATGLNNNTGAGWHPRFAKNEEMFVLQILIMLAKMSEYST
jgi:hypothetical protein